MSFLIGDVDGGAVINVFKFVTAPETTDKTSLSLVLLITAPFDGFDEGYRHLGNRPLLQESLGGYTVQGRDYLTMDLT